MAEADSGRDSLGRLLIYLQRYRARMGLGFLCVVGTSALVLANPLIIRYGIDSLTEASVTRERLILYAFVLIGLTFVQGVLRFLMRWLMIGVSRRIEYDLRAEIFAHLERLPQRFFQKNFTGDLISRSTNDLSNVRMLLGPGIMYTANTVVTTGFAVVLMLSIDWRLTVVALLPLLLISFSVRQFGRRIHQLSEASQERLASLSARVQESLSGIRVVKVFVQERYETRAFRELNGNLRDKNMELIRVTSLFFPTMQFTIGFGTVVVLWFGGRQVVQGGISIGEFVQFTLYLGILAWPMIALGWVINLLERGRASMTRLNHILDTKPEISDAADAFEPEISGEIEFRDLSFSHNGSRVLENISLRVPAGRTLAVVGPTGSGKSSLVQLIPRLYNPPPESLLIDGVPVERIRLGHLRRAIGFIPQETFLFGKTVFENIAFGVDAGTRAEVEAAARISSIYEDIRGFPGGFDTIVGERGITLSGGQKQRTAISRAVARNPKILVLDDALSSVDTYTEEQILKQLREVMRDCTSILISHRVSTVKHADEIVVLDHGRIVERGTHRSLLEADGKYAELHRKQLLEEELAVTE